MFDQQVSKRSFQMINFRNLVRLTFGVCGLTGFASGTISDSISRRRSRPRYVAGLIASRLAVLALGGVDLDRAVKAVRGFFRRASEVAMLAIEMVI